MPDRLVYRKNNLVTELTVTTRVMQSSFNELSSSVADSVKCKQKEIDKYTLNSLPYVGVLDSCGIMLSGWRSQLEASRVSSYIDELWYYETVYLWMIIYIYLCRAYIIIFKKGFLDHLLSENTEIKGRQQRRI